MLSESVSLSGPQICLSRVWGHRNTLERALYARSSRVSLPALATTQTWPQHAPSPTSHSVGTSGLRGGSGEGEGKGVCSHSWWRRREEETQGPSGRWSKYQLGPSCKLWLLQEGGEPAARRGRAARAAPARGRYPHKLALGRTTSAQLLRKRFHADLSSV